MILIDDIKRQIGEIEPTVHDLADALAIDRCKLRLDELENKSSDPSFYNNPADSGKVFAQMGELKQKIEDYAALTTLLSDTQTLCEMCEEGDDEELKAELEQSVAQLSAKVEEMRGRRRHRGTGLGRDAVQDVH